MFLRVGLARQPGSSAQAVDRDSKRAARGSVHWRRHPAGGIVVGRWTGCPTSGLRQRGVRRWPAPSARRVTRRPLGVLSSAMTIPLRGACRTDLATEGLWNYVRAARGGQTSTCTATLRPPTPFLLKDWERYDVSRYVDPLRVPGRDGIALSPHETRWATMTQVALLVGDRPLDRAPLLHAPPAHGSRSRGWTVDGRTRPGGSSMSAALL